MPGYNVVGPAEAFSTTLEDAILKHDVAQHQAKIAERQAKLDQAKLSQDKALLELRQKEEEDRQEDRKTALAEKAAAVKEKEGTDIAGRLVTGDVITPDIAKVLPPGLVIPGTPATPAVPAGPNTAPLAGTSIPMERDVANATPAVAATPATFRGLPAARIAAQKTAAQNALIEAEPDPRIQRAARFAQSGLPISELNAPKETLVKVTWRDPKTGKNMEKEVSPAEAAAMGEMESPAQPKPPAPENIGSWQLHEVADPANPGKTKLVMFNSKTQQFRDATQNEAPVVPKPSTKKTDALTPEQKLVYAAALKRRQKAATWFGMEPGETQQKQIEADSLAEALASSGEHELTDDQKAVIKALQAR